jgi:outer membrane protein assembly factor BamA
MAPLPCPILFPLLYIRNKWIPDFSSILSGFSGVGRGVFGVILILLYGLSLRCEAVSAQPVMLEIRISPQKKIPSIKNSSDNPEEAVSGSYLLSVKLDSIDLQLLDVKVVDLEPKKRDSSYVELTQELFKKEALNEFVQQKLWDLGFLDAKPDSIALHHGLIKVWILHPARYQWSADPWRFTSEVELLDCTKPASGSFFAIQEVFKCRDHLLRQLHGLAYLEAGVEIDSLLIDEAKHQVGVSFRIVKQERAQLDRVQFNGNKSASTWLEQLSGLRPGLPLTQVHLEESKQRLIQSKRFITVSDPIVIKSDLLWSVDIDVREKPLSQFDLIVGYTPTTTGRAQLVGTGSLWLHHVLTDGNHWRLNYHRLKPNAGHLELEVEQVGLGTWPVGLSINTQLTQQDSLWNARVFKLSGWWKYKPGFSIVTSLMHESVNYPSRLAKIDQHTGWYGSFGIVVETLDNWINPRKGLEFTLTADRGNQRLRSGTSGRRELQYRQRLHVTTQMYVPLAKRWVIKGSLVGAWLGVPQFQDSDLYRVGGVNSIRGYQEEQFSATRYLIADSEIRFLLDRTSNFFVFHSQGLIGRPTFRIDQREDQSVKIDSQPVRSFGMGLSYATNLGIMKISIAKNPEITLANSMIHIGFSTLF